MIETVSEAHSEKISLAATAMGKKDGAKKVEEAQDKAAPVSNAPELPKDKNQEEDEDTPVIKALKVIDETYCIAEVAMEREIEKLHKEFLARQAPILEERAKILSDASEAQDEDKTKATPACPNFWVQALSNASQIEEYIFECDEQAFEYITDIKASYIDAECEKKGYRVELSFAENPFFTNTSLWLEAHYDYDFGTARPWKEPDCIELKSCTIDWKPGKNFTMDKKKDAPSKKGKKRAGKAKEEPCPSFFRAMFTSCKKSDEEMPEGMAVVYEALGETPDDEDEMLEMHLGMVGSVCGFMHSELVPYAVRFYTGEACEDDDDDDEESEEESGAEDSDEEESDDDEPAPRGRGGKKPKGVDAKKGGVAAEGAGQKTEECKQQ